MSEEDYAQLLERYIGQQGGINAEIVRAAHQVQLHAQLFRALPPVPPGVRARFVVMLIDGDPLAPVCFCETRLGLMFIGPRCRQGEFIIQRTSRGLTLARDLRNVTIN